jgi:hypothetical protein
MPADGYTTPNDDESPAQANLGATRAMPAAASKKSNLLAKDKRRAVMTPHEKPKNSNHFDF